MSETVEVSCSYRGQSVRRAPRLDRGKITVGRHRLYQGVAIQIVFETHSTTEDNEAGIATGWLPGRLSDRGRQNAIDLGRRRRNDGLAAVFVSDLARAVETVEVAFGAADIPVLKDWRLRECDYGRMNGSAAKEVHGHRQRYLDAPYPEGESWRQATDRVGRFLQDLPQRWNDLRILVVGHVATRWGLERFVSGSRLEELIVADFEWREGWDYRLD